MRLKVACVVYFELKNINRNKNFVKITSYLCNGFVMFFLIEDYEGKTNYRSFFPCMSAPLSLVRHPGVCSFSGKTNTYLTYSDSVDHKSAFLGLLHKHTMKGKVLPRFELGYSDSNSKVLTVSPQNRRAGKNHYFKHAKVLDNDRVCEV